MPIASKFFAFIMYADDTTLLYTIKPQDFINPQQLAAKIKKTRKQLALNIIKSKSMLFYMPQRKITPPKLYIDGILIDYVTFFNFLGINIQNNLKWYTHINSISLKIGRTVGILNKLKHSLSLNILHLLYCTLIVFHLHYGIWL